jgi:hypothetical protein
MLLVLFVEDEYDEVIYGLAAHKERESQPTIRLQILTTLGKGGRCGQLLVTCGMFSIG